MQLSCFHATYSAAMLPCCYSLHYSVIRTTRSIRCSGPVFPRPLNPLRSPVTSTSSPHILPCRGQVTPRNTRAKKSPAYAYLRRSEERHACSRATVPSPFSCLRVFVNNIISRQLSSIVSRALPAQLLFLSRSRDILFSFSFTPPTSSLVQTNFFRRVPSTSVAAACLCPHT